MTLDQWAAPDLQRFSDHLSEVHPKNIFMDPQCPECLRLYSAGETGHLDPEPYLCGMKPGANIRHSIEDARMCIVPLWDPRGQEELA